MKALKLYFKTAALALLSSALIALPVIGCAPQQTLAALTQELGTASQSIATLEGNTALAAQLKTDTAAAVSAITNWKTGTPAQDVIQALNVVEGDLNLIPPASQYAPLIDVAIGTVEGILALLPAPTAAVVHASAARRTVILTQKAPVNAKQFKKQWNQVVSTHPGLAAATLK